MLLSDQFFYIENVENLNIHHTYLFIVNIDIIKI